MTFTEELNNFLVNIERGKVTDISDAYVMLTRCFLRLRSQDHEIRVLEDKLNVGSE